jgi:hypothetical protein
MMLSRTAAQRSSEAYRASLRPAIERWHHTYPRMPWEPDWDALQAEEAAAQALQAEEAALQAATTFAEVWVALGARPGDVLAWNAETSYAAITIDCQGQWCDDDEHRAPCPMS